MESRHLSLPKQRNYEYGYQHAYKLACDQLTKIGAIDQLCLRSGTQYQVIDSQKIMLLKYLNQTYQITLSNMDIPFTDSKQEVPISDKILMLHYLTSAKGTPISNKLIAYKELPEGANYFPTFAKRAIKPLLDHFGKEPHLLLDVAHKLGGDKAEYGDVAVTINAFTYVPITLVMWRGDEEFAPEGSILFDSTISDYLSAYDINVLCETIAWRLVKFSKGA
jgi:hypothetical protein